MQQFFLGTVVDEELYRICCSVSTLEHYVSINTSVCNFVSSSQKPKLGPDMALFEEDMANPGQVIGPWTVEEKINSGSYGQVYRARLEGSAALHHTVRKI